MPEPEAAAVLGRVEVLLESADELGESPLWDSATRRLWWIDGPDGEVHHVPVDDAADRAPTTIRLGSPLGAIALTDGPAILVAFRDGRLADVADGSVSDAARVPLDRPSRLNDGAADAAGGYWIGAIPMPEGPAEGVLAHWTPGEEPVVVERGLRLPNGIGWSPDGRVMYHVDSLAREIHAYDVDPAAPGRLGTRRVLRAFSERDGLPDGLAVDTEGSLWVAMWDGWCVRRIGPDGQDRGRLPLPVGRVTSCAFGDRGVLYVTSARDGLDAEALADQPLAGEVFVASVDAVGLPRHRVRSASRAPRARARPAPLTS